MCIAHVTTEQAAKRTGGVPGLGRLLPKMLGAALFAVLLMAGVVRVGDAAVPQEDPFAGVEVLGATEMAEKRGGFFHPSLGITLNLGANIKSMLNGSLVLETFINLGLAAPGTITHKFGDITGL